LCLSRVDTLDEDDQVARREDPEEAVHDHLGPELYSLFERVFPTRRCFAISSRGPEEGTINPIGVNDVLTWLWEQRQQRVRTARFQKIPRRLPGLMGIAVLVAALFGAGLWVYRTTTDGPEPGPLVERFEADPAEATTRLAEQAATTRLAEQAATTRLAEQAATTRLAEQAAATAAAEAATTRLAEQAAATAAAEAAATRLAEQAAATAAAEAAATRLAEQTAASAAAEAAAAGRLPEDGPFERYWDNGALMTKGFTQDNKLVGRVESYREDGTLEFWNTWVDGVNLGPYERYHPNGRLYARGVMEENQLHGPYEKYDSNGQLIDKGTFQNGEACGGWITDGEPRTFPSCSSNMPGSG
jgi:hypothetical protein